MTGITAPGLRDRQGSQSSQGSQNLRILRDVEGLGGRHRPTGQARAAEASRTHRAGMAEEAGARRGPSGVRAGHETRTAVCRRGASPEILGD
jgi:hypothetical protein